MPLLLRCYAIAYCRHAITPRFIDDYAAADTLMRHADTLRRYALCFMLRRLMPCRFARCFFDFMLRCCRYLPYGYYDMPARKI